MYLYFNYIQMTADLIKLSILFIVCSYITYGLIKSYDSKNDTGLWAVIMFCLSLKILFDIIDIVF